MDTQLTDRLIAAALNTLQHQGWSGLNADRLAQQTRAGKAGIYRRWPNMYSLGATAVRQLRLLPPAEHVERILPGTAFSGGGAGKVIAGLVWFNHGMCEPLTPAGQVIGATLSIGRHHPEVAASVEIALWEPLAEGIALITGYSGDPSDPGGGAADVRRVLETVCRGLWTDYLISGTPLSLPDLQSVLTLIWSSSSHQE